MERNGLTTPDKGLHTPLASWQTLYPSALAGFAVLSLYQANLDEVSVGQVIRPLLLAVILSAALTWLLRWLASQASRGGLLAAGVVVLFFSYGHVYSWLRGIELGGLALGQHRYALLLAGLAGVAWLLLAVRWLRQPSVVERAIALMAVVALIMPLSALVIQGAQRALARPVRLSGPTPAIEVGPQATLPDIYYLVLDGYGRQDVLETYYQHDNQAMLDALQAMGFHVAERSYSNYNQTVLSLASSLNMAYLDEIASQATDEADGRRQLTDTLKHSRVRDILQGLGYETVAFETGYSPTEWRDADLFLSPLDEGMSFNRAVLESAYISPFESQLLATTAVRLAFDFDLLRRWLESAIGQASPYLRHRARVEFAFETLPTLAERPGPTFVFAHIITPHPPFVFGEKGEPQVPPGAFSLADADAFGGSPADYVVGYRRQLTHINQLLLSALEAILARSDRPPVIIVQGDHGPGAHMVWSSPEQSLLVERMAILNAYYFPGESPGPLADDLSPVNSFRLVLAALGGDLPELLPNRSYFATWEQPLDFHDVTEELP